MAGWAAGMVLLPMSVQAATGPSALAAQVNAQIVQRHVNDGVAWIAGASGNNLMPRDVPAGCEPDMRAAATRMATEMVRFMQGAFDDPVYQRGFERRLDQAWSDQQLQRFLDRRDGEDLGALNTEVMSAPGLQAAQDAHLAKLADAADNAMHADPGMHEALAEVARVQKRCDALRMEASAE